MTALSRHRPDGDTVCLCSRCQELFSGHRGDTVCMICVGNAEAQPPPRSERNWPQGDYHHSACVECGLPFSGPKSYDVCRTCVLAKADTQQAGEQQDDTLLQWAHRQVAKLDQVPAAPQDAMTAIQRHAALRALNEFGCSMVIHCLVDGGYKAVIGDGVGSLCSATSPDPMVAFSQAHTHFVRSHITYAAAYRAYLKAQGEQNP